jgi:hypothetical protein
MSESLPYSRLENEMDSVIIWRLFGVYSYRVQERIVGNIEKP